LLVNVLKKEVVFSEGIPIIKVCVAGGDVEKGMGEGKTRTEEICDEGRGRTTCQEELRCRKK